MKIKKGYDDDGLQSINFNSWGIDFHLFVEDENIDSWEDGLWVLQDFIQNPMDWHIGMFGWWHIKDNWTEKVDVTFELWYQDDERYIQISPWVVEIWLNLDKKQMLYFAWVLKDCIEYVKEKKMKKSLAIW